MSGITTNILFDNDEDNSMFAKLPKHIQERILYYLQTNNFPAAKALRDAWAKQQ